MWLRGWEVRQPLWGGCSKSWYACVTVSYSLCVHLRKVVWSAGCETGVCQREGNLRHQKVLRALPLDTRIVVGNHTRSQFHLPARSLKPLSFPLTAGWVCRPRAPMVGVDRAYDGCHPLCRSFRWWPGSCGITFPYKIPHTHTTPRTTLLKHPPTNSPTHAALNTLCVLFLAGRRLGV